MAAQNWVNIGLVNGLSPDGTNPSPETQLCVEKLVQAINKIIIVNPHYWPTVRGIHWWPVDSQHKRPVMQKPFQCHDVIMESRSQIWILKSYWQAMGCLLRELLKNTGCYNEIRQQWLDESGIHSLLNKQWISNILENLYYKRQLSRQ